MPKSNTEQYAARVDAHLPTLANDAARREFLNGQLSIFETAYADFQRQAAQERAPKDVRAADCYPSE